jgi:hypothetical protein
MSKNNEKNVMDRVIEIKEKYFFMSTVIPMALEKGDSYGKVFANGCHLLMHSLREDIEELQESIERIEKVKAIKAV